MTNRFNVGEPVGDLLIWNSRQLVEDPADMKIIDVRHVRDAQGYCGVYANVVLSGVGRLIEAEAGG